MAPSQAILYASDERVLPPAVRSWLEARSHSLLLVTDPDDLMAITLRGRPRMVIFDAQGSFDAAREACRRLKSDSYTAVIPTLVVVRDDRALLQQAFATGADEVLMASMSAEETLVRLDALIRRADRDLYVHPSTRLPGPPGIEAEIARRMATPETFAVCYADLDHFKEYNDRYSYFDGDRVIRILAKILHDVVKGVCGENGFVGHIGGDDFIFIIPASWIAETCQEIVSIFDALVPFQYSEQDRRAGYYFGKDRRGQLHRVPLMTVSIGIVTNERRHFTHPGQVSELATEMKSYAKTLPGSVFVVDRRHDPVVEEAAPQPAPLEIGKGK
ncbi:MAG TPA: diguanylate cyclase [Gemmatimonadaceae bacterium]|nr:diguanylate cyclase [Gemmatimonadaceae bacterium]